MSRTFTATCIGAIFLATGALAQSTADDQGWPPNANEAFFTNSSRGTLRPDADIQANWLKLTDGERKEVQDTCSGKSTTEGGQVVAGGKKSGAGNAPISPDNLTHLCMLVGVM